VFWKTVLLPLSCCLLVAGCRSEPERRTLPLAVVVSGDTAGSIVPCGCASDQWGGLPRRATYVNRLRKEQGIATLVVSAGGAPGGTSAYDRLKFQAILRGEQAMGIEAHNIGAAEAALGPAELRRLARDTGVVFTSANVRDRSGALVGPRLVVNTVSGRNVGVLGVLDEQFATDELRLAPPRQAILDTLETAGHDLDAVIVLAYLPEQTLRRLAEALPEVDVIVGGPTGQRILPERVGRVLLTSATNRGRVLARLDAPLSNPQGRWSARIVKLDDSYADNPAQIENVRRFYAELAERDFAPGETSFVESMDDQAGAGVAGTRSCRECHEDDCRLWDESRHARAFESLRAKGAHVDPDCQRCHTDGYGRPGGFVSVRRSPERRHVGCESCHGPSQAHVDKPEVRTPHYTRAKDHCTACHDRENSPEFELEGYWAKIRHGEESP